MIGFVVGVVIGTNLGVLLAGILASAHRSSTKIVMTRRQCLSVWDASPVTRPEHF